MRTLTQALAEHQLEAGAPSPPSRRDSKPDSKAPAAPEVGSGEAGPEEGKTAQGSAAPHVCVSSPTPAVVRTSRPSPSALPTERGDTVARAVSAAG